MRVATVEHVPGSSRADGQSILVAEACVRNAHVTSHLKRLQMRAMWGEQSDGARFRDFPSVRKLEIDTKSSSNERALPRSEFFRVSFGES
jgi:hypothetical protein